MTNEQANSIEKAMLIRNKSELGFHSCNIAGRIQRRIKLWMFNQDRPGGHLVRIEFTRIEVAAVAVI